jgi:hypothetical protein
MTLGVDSARVYLFDAATGTALAGSAATAPALGAPEAAAVPV